MSINFDVLEGVKEGDKLVVRFKREDSQVLLAYIEAMARAGVVTVPDLDQMFLAIVQASNDWKDDDPTQTLTVGPDWNRFIFESIVGCALESLQVERAS